jgi:hypothetical protein
MDVKWEREENFPSLGRESVGGELSLNLNPGI